MKNFLRQCDRIENAPFPIIYISDWSFKETYHKYLFILILK